MSEIPLEAYNPLFSESLLAGKVAFVTGGATGIGFRITEMLMRHGCDTVIASRNAARLAHASKVLEAAIPSRKCVAVAMDVREPGQVKAAVQTALDTFGRLDIVVNCTRPCRVPVPAPARNRWVQLYLSL